LRISHLWLAVLVAALAACSSGPKQTTPPRWSPNKEEPRDENFHGGPNAMLLKYDANHDGTLTRDELITGLRAEFDRYDTGHTGCLTPDQVAAINQARIDADQSTATPLQDWNNDGCVDFREFATAAFSLFDQLDRNNDGKITPQEFNPQARPGARGAGEAGQDAGRGGGGRGGRGGSGGGPPGGGS
jgi:Ca2+-binding EF-hand superfamily protein